MRLLLDTHAFLWFITDAPKLSSRAKNLMEDPENDRIMSVASLWEIAVKNSLGKLELKEPFEIFIPRQLERNAIALRSIEVEHLAKVVKLPFHHRDPFDRLIVAQALAENLSIVSIDSRLDDYGISRLW